MDVVICYLRVSIVQFWRIGNGKPKTDVRPTCAFFCLTNFLILLRHIIVSSWFCLSRSYYHHFFLRKLFHLCFILSLYLSYSFYYHGLFPWFPLPFLLFPFQLPSFSLWPTSAFPFSIPLPIYSFPLSIFFCLPSSLPSIPPSIFFSPPLSPLLALWSIPPSFLSLTDSSLLSLPLFLISPFFSPPYCPRISTVYLPPATYLPTFAPLQCSLFFLTLLLYSPRTILLSSSDLALAFLLSLLLSSFLRLFPSSLHPFAHLYFFASVFLCSPISNSARVYLTSSSITENQLTNSAGLMIESKGNFSSLLTASYYIAS